jgi:hypothetical protein
MKNLAILVTLFFGLLIGTAAAQQTVITADIPFSFTVENTTLQAGKYEVRQVDTWEFVLAAENGDVEVLFLTEPAEAMKNPANYELQFDVIDGKHFLSKIWYQDDNWGYYLIKSRMERALLKKEAIKAEKVTAKKK